MKNTVRLVIGGLLCGATALLLIPAVEVEPYRRAVVRPIVDATVEASWYVDWLQKHTDKCEWVDYRDWRSKTESTPEK